MEHKAHGYRVVGNKTKMRMVVPRKLIVVVKRRGQPCACVRCTYLAGGYGCSEYADIITGIIKLLLWSRSTEHYLGITGRILRINKSCARCKL